MENSNPGQVPPDGSGMGREIKDAGLLLTTVRETIGDLLAAVRDGQFGEVKDTVETQKLLAAALIKAFEAEQKYHDWFIKHGGTDPADLDYDAVRHQIGCRLDRIRACCREG